MTFDPDRVETLTSDSYSTVVDVDSAEPAPDGHLTGCRRSGCRTAGGPTPSSTRWSPPASTRTTRSFVCISRNRCFRTGNPARGRVPIGGGRKAARDSCLAPWKPSGTDRTSVRDTEIRPSSSVNTARPPRSQFAVSHCFVARTQRKTGFLDSFSYRSGRCSANAFVGWGSTISSN